MFSKYKKIRKTHKQNEIKKKNTNNHLTKKRITFNLDNNEFKKIYYPELRGKNISLLRRDNDEDDEDDDEYDDTEEEIIHTPKNFRIQDISEIEL